MFAEWFDGNERPADSVPRPSEISSCTGWKIPRHGGYASESCRTPNSLVRTQPADRPFDPVARDGIAQEHGEPGDEHECPRTESAAHEHRDQERDKRPFPQRRTRYRGHHAIQHRADPFTIDKKK